MGGGTSALVLRLQTISTRSIIITAALLPIYLMGGRCGAHQPEVLSPRDRTGRVRLPPAGHASGGKEAEMKHWSFRSNISDFDFARIIREAEACGAQILEITRGKCRVVLASDDYIDRLRNADIITGAFVTNRADGSSRPRDVDPPYRFVPKAIGLSATIDGLVADRRRVVDDHYWYALYSADEAESDYLHTRTRAADVQSKLNASAAARMRTTVVCLGEPAP